MLDVLDNKVIVLNKNWQVIDQITVQRAISQMAADAATGLEINGKDNIRPVSWSEWITLVPRPDDNVIRTTKLVIRAPTVVVAVNYGGFPKKRPKLSLKEVARRDGGICQYTRKKLKPSEMSLDHVIPKSRGGDPKSWTNIVLADRQINNKKGNKLNHEAGLHLIRQPRDPGIVNPADDIVPAHPDHLLFVNLAS